MVIVGWIALPLGHGRKAVGAGARYVRPLPTGISARRDSSGKRSARDHRRSARAATVSAPHPARPPLDHGPFLRWQNEKNPPTLSLIWLPYNLTTTIPRLAARLAGFCVSAKAICHRPSNAPVVENHESGRLAEMSQEAEFDRALLSTDAVDGKRPSRSQIGRHARSCRSNISERDKRL